MQLQRLIVVALMLSLKKIICGSGVDIMPCHVVQKSQSWQIASAKNN